MKMPRILFSSPRDELPYSPLDNAINAGVLDLFPKDADATATIKPSAIDEIQWRQAHSSTRLHRTVLLRLAAAGVLISLATIALIYAICALGARWPENSPAQRESMLDLGAEFVKFEAEYGKKWDSDAERERRRANFIRNYLEAQRLDQTHGGGGGNKSSSARFGVNGMADMSDVEFREMLMPLDQFPRRGNHLESTQPVTPIYENTSGSTPSNYPPHFDWRTRGVVNRVKVQKPPGTTCGSCWAFATVATVESAYAIAHGELRSLSEQELLDCNLENHACEGGDPAKAFHFVHQTGLMLEDSYPYVARRQNTCRLDTGALLTKIDVSYLIHPDEQSITDWLVSFGPVNIAITVPPELLNYVSGVYSPSDYDCKYRSVGGHSLVIVGYGTGDEGEKYWIVKNSWGPTWGIEGYVLFARGVNACGIEDEPIGVLA